ncbi:MAG: ABC transporter substrate-binding protein [Holosporales bacterium]|jgi:putative ABC transport system substrate-binding protein|nr:ABC transporter substrate-binding protein [Holosporales bacterium]
MLKKVIYLGIIMSNILVYSYNVSILKIVDHPALNAVVVGVEKELQNDKEAAIKVYSAQGNQSMAASILAKFASEKSDYILTIGTTPTQLAYQMKQQGKFGRALVVGASITNPTDISPSESFAGTIIVSNFVPIKPQIEVMIQINQSLKKIAIIYNPGESNSVAIVAKLKPIAEEMGIELIEKTIQKSSDIPQATNAAVAAGSDAVFISNDNTALAGIPCIVKICTKAKIPVYCSDTDQVANGCLAALGPNQFQIGVKAGQAIKQSRNGESIEPVQYPGSDDIELCINLKTAKQLGVQIPEELLTKAVKTVE